ncbi:hypothetical protein [Cronobacter malonaticus]|uniref:tail fiber/spike domain-containing protein n=1 Tax=Cronobacter malonaticus TaxID=413503 RepID=UPI001F1C9BD9|nr:hypothetical protein [Cronobacter malonaticus]
MATQPTQNAVPSESPRDLKFNAGKIDEFVTSLERKYIDRFGGEHYTIEGLRWLIQQAISSMGWVLIDSFQDGADITLPNQALRDEVSGEYYRWDGALPKHVDAGSTPASSGGIGVGAWVGVGDASLRAYLATVAGAASIGLKSGGNLQQAITWVTPEQFGAIGDGTPHPLSERYATLAAAQAVYPFVTSLTQTIDWAACQAAENYARGKCQVYVNKNKLYHLGESNYIEFGQKTAWIAPPLSGFDLTTGFIRKKPATKPAFGQLCVGRVMNSSEAGSADEAFRDITIIGLSFSWEGARHAASKGDQTICLHMNYSIKANVDICCYGGEYGYFGYSSWGHKGTIRFNSCHKALYMNAYAQTPEKPTNGGSTTAHELRLEIDHCIYPVYLRNCSYFKLTGFFEGADITYPLYDYTKETAMGITLEGCNGFDIQMGVEYWMGSLVNCINNCLGNINFYYYQDKVLVKGLGVSGVGASMAAITPSFTDNTSIPSSNRSLIYLGDYCSVQLFNFNPTASKFTDSTFSPYVCTVAATSYLAFIGGLVLLNNGNNLLLAPGNYKNIDSLNCQYLDGYLRPDSGYTYMGKGFSKQMDFQSKTINGTGDIVLNSPTGYKIVGVEAFVVANTGATGATALKNAAADGSSVTLQTAVSSTGYNLYYRLSVFVTK